MSSQWLKTVPLPQLCACFYVYCHVNQVCRMQRGVRIEHSINRANIFGHLNIIPSLISEECTIPDAWQNKMFSITSTLNDNSSANFNKSISFGVSTAIWKEPDSFSSWRCHYVDNSSIVLKRYDICMRGSREGSGIQIDSFLPKFTL